MLNKNEREAIIRRIMALMAKTTENGCTMEEAMAASKLVGDLMDKYSLSLSDIELRETSKVVKDTIDTGLKGAQAIDYVVMAIGYFTDCKVWKSTNNLHGFVVYYFFGLEHEVQIAKYIFKVCDWAITWGWEDYKRENPRFKMTPPSGRGKLKAAFQMGEANELSRRLRAMKDGRNAENIATTGRDLVVVKSAIVEEEFNKLQMKLTEGKQSHRRYDSSSYWAGVEAGKRVALNEGVRHNNSNGGLLD